MYMWHFDEVLKNSNISVYGMLVASSCNLNKPFLTFSNNYLGNQHNGLGFGVKRRNEDNVLERTATKSNPPDSGTGKKRKHC
jgi:hypothetical protein